MTSIKAESNNKLEKSKYTKNKNKKKATKKTRDCCETIQLALPDTPQREVLILLYTYINNNSQ